LQRSPTPTGFAQIVSDTFPVLHFIFPLAPCDIANQSKWYERLHENSLFDSGRSGLHGILCGGQAELQQDRKELSHERQQGMQLREELRLLSERSISLLSHQSN
jgi:hypothetical protein